MLATKTNFCFPPHIQTPWHKNNCFAKNSQTAFFQGYLGRRWKEAQSPVLSQAQAASHVEPHKVPKRREGGQQSSPEKRWEPAGADWGCGLPIPKAADPPIQVGPGTHFYSTGVLARRLTQGQPLSPVLAWWPSPLDTWQPVARLGPDEAGGLQSQTLHLLHPRRDLLRGCPKEALGEEDEGSE